MNQFIANVKANRKTILRASIVGAGVGVGFYLTQYGIRRAMAETLEAVIEAG